MSTPAFNCSVSGAVATIELCRPDTGNKMISAEVAELGMRVREFGADPAVKIVVLRAMGKAFCLGRDASPGEKDGRAYGVRNAIAEPILSVYAALRDCPVPVLAVAQGDAHGFGCAMIGGADLTIAADTARFSMPEMNGNLPPTLAISSVLGKVPPKRLMHMVYSRTTVSAAEALTMGLVSEVAPAADLDAAVTATIGRIIDRDRRAICAVKEYMNAAIHMDPAGSARLAANMLGVILGSE